jgi:hypothetical protein
MADICKCLGTDCPLKEKCFRYKAPESYFQSYFLDVPIVNGVCEYFIELFRK